MCNCQYWRFRGKGWVQTAALHLLMTKSTRDRNPSEDLGPVFSLSSPAYTGFGDFYHVSSDNQKYQRHSPLLLTNFNFYMPGTSNRTLFTAGVAMPDPLTYFSIHSNGNCAELSQLCEQRPSDPVCAGGHKVAISEGRECWLCAVIHHSCGSPSPGALGEQDTGNTLFFTTTLSTLYSSCVSGIN